MYSLTNRRVSITTLLLTICAASPALSSPVPSSPPSSTASAVAPLFTRGELVRLRSGGPMMTISAIKGDQVECVWTDDTGQPEDATFPTDVLQKF